MSRQLKIGLLLGFIALATVFTATVSSAEEVVPEATQLEDAEAEIVANLEVSVAKKLHQLQNR